MVTYHTYFYFPPGASISENYGHSGLVGTLKFMIHTKWATDLRAVLSYTATKFLQAYWSKGGIFTGHLLLYMSGTLCVILSKAHESPRREWVVRDFTNELGRGSQQSTAQLDWHLDFLTPVCVLSITYLTRCPKEQKAEEACNNSTVVQKANQRRNKWN